MKTETPEKYSIPGRPSIRFRLLRNILSVPFIYSVVIPVLFLDLVVTVYQAVCFRLYKIPKINRHEYVQFKRSEMEALNWVDKLHCHYCSYVNGILAYALKIAGQTEKIWCPIKPLPEGKLVELPHRKNFVIRVKKASLEQYYEQYEKHETDS